MCNCGMYVVCFGLGFACALILVVVQWVFKLDIKE